MADTEPSCVLRTDYRHGSECRQPALYRVYGVGCYVCIDVGFCDGCIGHLVCADHAAKLRTESVAQVPARSRKNVPAFVVERIHSLATDAAWLDALFAEPERELASLPAWARPVVTPSRTDRQPPTSASETKGGTVPDGPAHNLLSSWCLLALDDPDIPGTTAEENCEVCRPRT